MSTAESRVAQIGLSAEQVLILENCLRKLLESRAFRNSKRFPALMEYAIRHTLENSEHKLKERNIGVDVFGRPADYDPSVDPVVRVAFGEIRKRLAIFYNEHPDEPVLIHFPVGGYAAEFNFRQPAQELLPAGSRSQVSAQPKPSSFVQHLKQLLPRRTRSFTVLAILLLAIVAITSWYAVRAAEKQDLWKPLLTEGTTPTIVVGEGPSYDLARQFNSASISAATEPVQILPPPKFLPMKMGNAQGAAQVCGSLRLQHRNCHIVSANIASFADLRDHNMVLVGGVNNFWSIRVLEPLRFHFVFDHPNSPAESTMLGIADSFQPGQGPQWSITAHTSQEPGTDYSILARIHSELTDSTVMVIGGLGPIATASAGEFLADSQKVEKVLASAPKNWGGLNFEIVLQADAIRGHYGHTKVVATHFW